LILLFPDREIRRRATWLFRIGTEVPLYSQGGRISLALLDILRRPIGERQVVSP